jgi:hypothetical protein
LKAGTVILKIIRKAVGISTLQWRPKVTAKKLQRSQLSIDMYCTVAGQVPLSLLTTAEGKYVRMLCEVVQAAKSLSISVAVDQKKAFRNIQKAEGACCESVDQGILLRDCRTRYLGFFSA